MRIGYACQTVGVPATDYRSCLAKNATPSVLAALIEHNLGSLGNAVAYNLREDIRLFRITSDLIPFGSSPVNMLPWWSLFAPQLASIGAQIRSGNLRASLHPGQYTVLNSPRPDVVQRAVADLQYHARILDALALGPEHKIILHVGGVYGDKAAATSRFAEVCLSLDEIVRRRLVIENDDRCYTIADVLALGRQLAVPVVFDNLHHRLNPPRGQAVGDTAGCADASAVVADEAFWISECRQTWLPQDGPQKIHYAQQDPAGRPGSHSRTIQVRPFLDFCARLPSRDVDIMLEVKDKNLSARKCLICADDSLPQKQVMKLLEQEWHRYKYTVLETSPPDYLAIRQLLADKAGDNRLPFYDRLEHALVQAPTPGTIENAALHVWGYFRKQASETEKLHFQQLLERHRQNSGSGAAMKRYLRSLTERYQQVYLLDSYYVMDLGER